MPRKRLEPAPKPEPLPLNPHFENMLPEMIEEFSQIIVDIKDHLESANIRTGQFVDHLRFEIDKTKLALEHLGWQSKVDPVEKDRLTAWLTKLTAIFDRIESEDARSSLSFIETMRNHLMDDLTPIDRQA